MATSTFCTCGRDEPDIDSRCRIRDEFHAISVGIELLRSQIGDCDHHHIDTTLVIIEPALQRIASDELLAFRSVASGKNVQH